MHTYGSSTRSLHCTPPVVLWCPADAEPQQRSTQQGTSQQQRLSRKIPAEPRSSSTPDELNRLPCSSIRCSLDLEPVCATGKGVGGCTTPDKGCTYTNGCLARCVYSAKISYMGECTHKNAMRIMEEGASAPTPVKDCKCPVNFQPVCDKGPACKIPGRPDHGPGSPYQ